MKTVNSVKITVNGSESKVFIANGSAFVTTKLGDMKITGTNSANKTISFEANGKEVFGVKFEGCFDTVNAIFNCANSEKSRELVIFDTYEEFLSVRDASFGAAFKVAQTNAAYKYL